MAAQRTESRDEADMGREAASDKPISVVSPANWKRRATVRSMPAVKMPSIWTRKGFCRRVGGFVAYLFSW